MRERLKEIIQLADKLGWIFPPMAIENSMNKKFHSSYPLMILSEVEKCMLAMTDEEEFNKLKEWANSLPKQ